MQPGTMVSLTELPSDIMRIISDLLLEKDVVDYISLRVVCHEWGLCTGSAMGLDFRFRPRHWIMLSEGDDANLKPSSRRFFNLSTGQVLKLSLPELNTFSVFSDCDGLLFLIDESTQAVPVRLFNPFTRRLARLPNLPVFLSTLENSWTSSISTSSCPSVMLFNRLLGSLYFAKTFYSTWLIFSFDTCPTPNSMLCFRGQFYFGISGCGIRKLDLQRRQLIVVISHQFDMISELLNRWYITEFNGEMLLLHRKYYSSFRVYRVDLESNGLVPMYYNRDLAIFLGERCFVFPLIGQAAEFGLPSLKPNSVYDCAGKKPFISISVCNIIDGQLVQPSTGNTFQDLRFPPLSLFQHFAAYSLNSF